MNAPRRTKRAVILESSLQFITVGTVTQLIGRDVLSNQDEILATFDNGAPFNPARLAADWQVTARLLGFTLIPTAQHSMPQSTKDEVKGWLAFFNVASALIGFAALILYMILKGLTK